jgi:Cof subfamily protein (haloacid dehalogenase superfamily)
MRTLVALDLDGTLLGYDSCLPAGHEHAIRELQRQGILVAIVTGRMVLTAQWVWEHLRLTTPLVAFNGGWVGMPRGQTMASWPLSGAEVRAIIAELRDEDGATCAYPDARTWLMNRDIPTTARWRDIYRIDIQVDPAPFRCWQGPSHKVMFVTAAAQVPAIAQRLRRRFAGRFQVVVSQEDRIEILPGPIHKAWGLAHLATHLGVARERVWAVGDADNDREMIAWAGHGCVMGQAHHSLRRIARHVLPGVQARGLCALPSLIARHA